jgi:hypothetical protein
MCGCQNPTRRHRARTDGHADDPGKPRPRICRNRVCHVGGDFDGLPDAARGAGRGERAARDPAIQLWRGQLERQQCRPGPGIAVKHRAVSRARPAGRRRRTGQQGRAAPVKVGRDFGQTVEILAGVTPADRVIVNPTDSLVNGTQVRIQDSSSNSGGKLTMRPWTPHRGRRAERRRVPREDARAWRCRGFTMDFSVAALALLAGAPSGPTTNAPTRPLSPRAYAGATGGWKVAQPQAQLPKGNWWEVFGDPQLNALEGRGLPLQISSSRPRSSSLLRPGPRPWISRGAAFYPDPWRSPGSTRASAPRPTRPFRRRAWRSANRAPTTTSRCRWTSATNSISGGVCAAASNPPRPRPRQAPMTSRPSVWRSRPRSPPIISPSDALDSEQAVLRSSVEVFSKSYGLTVDRRAGGVATDLEVAQAETVLKTTQAQLPEVALARAQFEHALALLTGRTASQFRVPESANVQRRRR